MIEISEGRRKDAELIYRAGLSAVLPSSVIPDLIRLRDNILTIGDRNFDLSMIENIWIIGAGKASAAMALEVEVILGGKISGGLISVKYGHSCKLSRIAVAECGHPLPDQNGFMAAEGIISIAAKAQINELVICLISGGGSSLMPDYPEGSGLEEIKLLNDLLVKSGATISEINCVRKHLSGIKGGNLARIVWPASLVTILISDVPGDDLSVIASGPVVADMTTFRDAIGVILKYDLASSMPPGLLTYLESGVAGHLPETPKPGDQAFEKTFNFLAATNIKALYAAKTEAEALGFITEISERQLSVDVYTEALLILEKVNEVINNSPFPAPVCIIAGGEPVLKVTGKGLGGRNQHLALLLAIKLAGMPGVTVLCAGTDGTDGPTDAAGAVVDSLTVPLAYDHGTDPADYLARFDSYSFFDHEGGHIITGPTLTNVMDMVIILIDPPD